MNRLLMVSVAVIWAASTSARTASTEVKAIVKEVEVAAPAQQVWEAWSTEAGLTTFFSRAANVDLRPGGDYEILFFPDNPPGSRGAEGTTLLAVEPPSRLAFTWNAPPNWPEIRRQKTLVSVTIESTGDDQSLVRLEHTGWGNNSQWEEVFEYFDSGWAVVLRRLQYRFNQGPLDWDQLPESLMAGGQPDADTPTSDSRYAQSVALVKEFGSQLQVELKQAMGSGGPVAAVAVCRDRAPQIASELSRQSGAKISRTSLKFRNPANAPEPWQQKKLTAFESLASSSSDTIDSFEADHTGARYMQAIRTGPVCLVCHGTERPDPLQQVLSDAYPHDRATGYRQGDVRGAFSVVWPGG